MNSVWGTCSIQASPEDHEDSGGFQVFLGFEFLPEIDFEGLVNSQAQSERAVLPLG